MRTRFPAQLDPKGLLLRGADASDNYTSELPSAADAHLSFTVHCVAILAVVSVDLARFGKTVRAYTSNSSLVLV